jgi:hypothetical protein
MGRVAIWMGVAVVCALGCSSDLTRGPDGAAAGRGGGVRPGSSARGGSGPASAIPVAPGNSAPVAPAACPEGLVRAERVTPRVVLLLDGSCSMSTDYPANGERSAAECVENAGGRWAALRNALIAPQTGVVSRLQGLVEFGLVVFGTEPMCPIPGTPIQPVLNNLPAIQTGIGAVQPGQFTPTGPALSWVYDNMLRQGVPDAKLGPQIVILATDGEPNACDSARTDYQPSIDAVTRSQQLGVSTYVISLADSTGDFHDHLQQLANLGVSRSDARLYEPSTPEQLSTDLELLIGGAVGCDIALNGTVTAGSECMGSVTISGRPLTCNDPNGWILSDPRHVRLQGAACEELKMIEDTAVFAKFPCEIFTPI